MQKWALFWMSAARGQQKIANSIFRRLSRSEYEKMPIYIFFSVRQNMSTIPDDVLISYFKQQVPAIIIGSEYFEQRGT